MIPSNLLPEVIDPTGANLLPSPGINQSNCIGEIAEFAQANNLLITPYPDFVKTCVVAAIIGAVIGIVCWELFKKMRAYGKRQATERQSNETGRFTGR